MFAGFIRVHAERESMERATITPQLAPFLRFVCLKTRG